MLREKPLTFTVPGTNWQCSLSYSYQGESKPWEGKNALLVNGVDTGDLPAAQHIEQKIPTPSQADSPPLIVNDGYCLHTFDMFLEGIKHGA